MATVTRHGRVSNAYKATLRKPLKADFDKLVDVCIKAIIEEEVDIYISFAYTLKFPATFPHGIIVSRESDGSNIYKTKAKRMLVWLHANKKTLVTVEMVGVQKRSFTNFEKTFDELNEINFEECLSNENLM